MNTKLHALADANGRPLSFFMTAGQVSDYTGAAALLVATRYDRCPTAFFSAVALAATVIFWL
jgi:transposase